MIKDTFVEKFETENFKIGSYDAYLEEIKTMIKNNLNISNEEIEEILKTMPNTYKSAIIDKQGNFIGCIGIYNIDYKNNISSIRLETVEELELSKKEEILSVYKSWQSNSLNLGKIEEIMYINQEKIEKEEQFVTRTKIILPPKNIKEGIDEKTLVEMKKYYNIPNLSFPVTLVNCDQVIGILGLTNLIWSNGRAILHMFFKKDINEELLMELGPYAVEQYLMYLKTNNLHNVITSVSSGDKEKLEILKNTNLNYFATIPYSLKEDNMIYSKHLFQQLSNPQTEVLKIPQDKPIILSDIKVEKNELSKLIELDSGFKLVSPLIFNSLGIEQSKLALQYAHCLADKNFASLLGEEKYVPRIGDEKSGIYKEINNLTYVLLDKNNDFAGFIDVLLTDADNKNAEIEIAIAQKYQRKGIGTKMATAFYDEMFSIGFTSITSGVFSFNNPSLKFHQKLANFNGIRLNSYYMNGKLWDIHYYTKVNPQVEELVRKTK